MKSIAVLTTVRNDTFFTNRWIEYYAKQFGQKSLYILLDGQDQPRPGTADTLNVIDMPYIETSLVTAEKRRASRTSDFAAALFHSYDIVIAVDIDEFIVLEPNLGISLAEYLSALDFKGSVSGLGVDVVQHPKLEETIIEDAPLLSQRRYAFLSSRYTKPAITNKPLRWGAGQHRIKGHNFRIDPNLFLFHFGSVDMREADSRYGDVDRVAAGWGKHQSRRNALFDLISKSSTVDGDSRFSPARREQTLVRPLYAWNKPGGFNRSDAITIPQRFKEIV